MLKVKDILTLIICFQLGLIVGVFSKVYYETIFKKPYYWSLKPIVVNCYGEEMNEQKVLGAIKFWENNDEHIAFYEHNPPEWVCKEESIIGFILLKKAKFNQLDSNTLASTRRYTSFEEIKASVIWFAKGSQNLDLLIEHEIGHAIGYSHVNEVGNVMNPVYENIGSNFKGVLE